ncbi:MAG: DNA/RNA nuclease SfsA [Alphaproteobacteria bacterium]
MEFPDPLVRGRLIRRYKRFLADVTLDTGETVTAHCANPGSMMGLAEPDMEVWLSPARNPRRKLAYTWELVRTASGLVGVNTAHPNAVAAEAIGAGRVPELAGYEGLRREVRYGTNSRIDLLLEDDARPPCYVEIKSVTLCRDDGLAEFPDAVSTRGAKHMGELAGMVAAGARSVLLYLVQRGDCTRFAVAADIDPAYAAASRAARAAGVELLCYACRISPERITVAAPLPFADAIRN